MAAGAAGTGLRSRGGILLAVVAGLSGAGCGPPAPRPLVEGSDTCDHCHMTMVDRRFAGELISTTGKIVPFDDVGCLALGAVAADPARVHSVWVSDYLEPDSMVAADRMVFLRSDSVQTPMRYGIVAVRPGPAADSLVRVLAGVRMTWAEVLAWARLEERP